MNNSDHEDLHYLPLLPPYLDKGSKGAAVQALQYLLHAEGFAVEGMLPDGDYGQLTADSVKYLQEELNLPADGNLGPATREAWKEMHAVSVDAIPMVGSQPTLYKSPDSDDLKCWPVS